MKHTITPFEGKNKVIAFANLIFGNFFLETDPGCYLAQPSLVQLDTQLELLPSPISGNDLCTIDISSASVGYSSGISNFWILYFDGSKTHGGFEVGYVLIDPQ